MENRQRVNKKPPLRLTKPLVRKDGHLEPSSWDEALSRAAQLLGHVRDTSGGNALAVFSCSKATNELNYLASKFARAVFGTNNIDSCNRT